MFVLLWLTVVWSSKSSRKGSTWSPVWNGHNPDSDLELMYGQHASGTARPVSQRAGENEERER